MGCYVDPPNESKENFLEREGIRSLKKLDTRWEETPQGYLPVVLVDNGNFTAAGIAVNDAELKYFLNSQDKRSRKVFFVKIDRLLQVSEKFPIIAKQLGII